MALVASALLRASSPSIRTLADYIQLPYSKQVKVNRIWRLINKSKSFDPSSIMSSLSFISHKLANSPFVIIDFTYLKPLQISLFIASIPMRGRSIPFYCKVLFLEDIRNMRWRSINHFIMSSVQEILEIVPKGAVFLADRQFGTKMLMKFFDQIRFIFRVRKDLKVEVDGKLVRAGELRKGKYLIRIEGKRYYLYVREEGREKLILLSNFEGRDSLRESRKYLKRSYCEQMHRDMKSRLNLLFLNKKYFKELDERKIEKYLVLFMLAQILGIWMGGLVRRSAHWIRFAGREDEKSLFHLGQIALILNLDDIALRLKISASMLFPRYGGDPM